MGNNCKSPGKPSNFVELHFERILYKPVDNNQHNIAELPHKVVGTKAKRFSTSEYGTKKCPHQLMPITEFIKICSRNRPAGISDISWDRFVSSVYLECCQIDVQGEVDKRGQVEAENSLSCLGYRLGKHKLMVEGGSGRSTPNFSDSSVEFIGKFLFPIDDSDKWDVDTVNSDVDTDKSDVVSNSLSSLSVVSLSPYRPDRLFAKYYRDLAGDEKVPSAYDKQLDLKYAFSLGDIQRNSCESERWQTENKIPSTASATTTEPGQRKSWH